MKVFLAVFTVILFIIPVHNLKAQAAHSLNIDNVITNSLYEIKPGSTNSGKVFFPNGQIYLPDSLILYTMSDTLRMSASYNRRGWNDQILLQLWSGGHWVNYARRTWTYLDSTTVSNLTLKEMWLNEQWTNSELDSSTYDAAGNMLVHLFKYWSQGNWIDSLLTFRTYDENENMLTNWGEMWSGAQWIILPESFNYIYTYDLNGHILTELYQILNNGQVENATLSTYTYDANGNMLSYLLQISANGQMTNSTIHNYTYDANGRMLTDWLKGWTNEAWMNGSLYTYTYDANGNMVNELIQYWLNGQWTNFYQTTYTYDSNGNLVTGYNYDWVNSSWVQADNTFKIPFYDGSYSIFIGYKIIISYTLLNITDVSTNTDNVVTEYSLSQNYPNPFNPATTISFSLPEKSFVSLKVFDIIGREVASVISEEIPAGKYFRQWNAVNFPSGIYFYRLQAGYFVETKKLILLK